MFIYLIESEETKKLKIGYTNDPQQRCKSLQTGNSEKLNLIYQIPVPEKKARNIEKKLHHELSIYRVRGEWFKMEKQKAISLMEYAVIRWVDDPLLE